MKQPSRARIIERGILIATVARDMESCEEHFALYSSVVFVLERNSEGYSTIRLSPSVLNLLGRHITGWWCMTEAMLSPFTTSDLRKAVADSLRLAKSELRKEDMEMLSDIDTIRECCCKNTYIDDWLYSKICNEYGDETYILANAIEEYIHGSLDDGHQLPGAMRAMKEEAPREMATIEDCIDREIFYAT